MANTAPIRWMVLGAFFAAGIAAILSSSQTFFSMVDHGHDYWRILGWQLVAWGYWAAVSPICFRLGSRFLRPHGRPALWPLALLSIALGLIFLHMVTGAVALSLFQSYVPVVEYSLGESYERMQGSWLGVDMIIFLVLTAAGYGLAGFWEARRRELRQSRLEAELAKAQLDALRLEIQPHFLFNTLNAIATQVRRRENDQALKMLLELSELLRSTLEHSSGPLVSLDEEVEFVQRYLELQRLRFGDQLTVEYEIASNCLEAAVPFLLLQPLAENAIRHGVRRRPGPGVLRLTAERVGERVELTVTDNGPGIPDDFDQDSALGVGLRNIRSRLSHIYGKEVAAIDLSNRQRGGAVARVSLPYERAPERSKPASAA